MPYVDPGAGTLLLQALVAGAVGAFFTFRAALVRFVRRLMGRSPD